jgi:hypothetical protein
MAGKQGYRPMTTSRHNGYRQNNPLLVLKFFKKKIPERPVTS